MITKFARLEFELYTKPSKHLFLKGSFKLHLLKQLKPFYKFKTLKHFIPE